jgi:hypothetical protein
MRLYRFGLNKYKRYIIPRLKKSFVESNNFTFKVHNTG